MISILYRIENVITTHLCCVLDGPDGDCDSLQRTLISGSAGLRRYPPQLLQQRTDNMLISQLHLTQSQVQAQKHLHRLFIRL